MRLLPPRFNGARRTFPFLVLCGFLCVAGATAFGDEPDHAGSARFRTTKVARGSIAEWIKATGTLEPEEAAEVGAQVLGPIERFGVDPHDAHKTIDFGTEVEKGTVLAYLDNTLYRASVNANKAELAKAEAVVALKDAITNGLLQEKGRLLAKAGAAKVTEAGLEELQTKLQVARTDKQAAEAQVSAARANLQTAQINLDYCTIRSPIEGVVVDRRVNVGQVVVSGLSTPALFLIAKDLRHLQLWASVNEKDAPRCRAGQQTTFTVAAFPGRTFKGVVEQVRLNAAVTPDRVTYTVVVKVDNADRTLLPYMTADVCIRARQEKDVLLVPTRALYWRPRLWELSAAGRAAFAARKEARRRERDQDNEASTKMATGMLWVPDGNGVRPVDVEMGLADDTRTQIRGGLKDGDDVVVEAAEAPAGAAKPGDEGPVGSSKEPLLTIEPGEGFVDRIVRDDRGRLGLTDLQAIARQCPHVVAAAPLIRVSQSLTYQHRQWGPLHFYGTDPSFFEVMDWPVEAGDHFSDSDVRRGAAVCLLGRSVAEALFQDKSPVGETVSTNGHALRVMGVLKSKGTGVLGVDRDDIVLTPWTMAREINRFFLLVKTPQEDPFLKGNQSIAPTKLEVPMSEPAPFREILVRVDSRRALIPAARELADVLRVCHRIGPFSLDDFVIRAASRFR